MAASRLTLVIALCGSLFACRSDPKRALGKELDRVYGPDATWLVGFARDSTHLLVQVQGAYFGSLPDSQFNDRARDIVRFAFRRYPAREALDSVTVAVGQVLSSGALGVFRVGRSITVPASSLRADVPAASDRVVRHN